MKKYRIRKYSIAWFTIRIMVIGIMAILIWTITGQSHASETEEVMTVSEEVVELEVVEEIEPAAFFPLTDEERELVERIVAAEGRGESIEAQIAIAQTIRDRAVTRKQSITKVCTAKNQFAAPYMGTISDKTKDAVSFAFDEGVSIFDAYVTHFYAWELIAPPDWTDDFDFLGEIGGTRFYGEAF